MSASVGENIRKIRMEKHLTQKQLGELLGVSPQMIGQYETGIRKPRYGTIKRIANALDVLELDIIDYNHPTNENRVSDSMLNAWLASKDYIKAEIGTEIEDESFMQFINNIAEFGSLLNSKGRQIAAERVEELTKIPEYRKDNE